LFFGDKNRTIIAALVAISFSIPLNLAK